MYIHIYIYIYIERERERERENIYNEPMLILCWTCAQPPIGRMPEPDTP
jgi:hypothetical protein